MNEQLTEQHNDLEKLPRMLDMVDPIEYHELLNSVAEEVSLEELGTPELQSVIDGMIDVANGKGHDEEDSRQVVGLAAPQIGVGKRIILIDMTASGAVQEQRLTEIINPEITYHSDDKLDGREGCWSCGDVCGNVARSRAVTVKGINRAGDSVTYDLDGFVARVVQHETDHLDGVRFPDRIPADEPWRLHNVRASQFEQYRTDWPNWPRLYSRSDWEKLRDGISREHSSAVIETVRDPQSLRSLKVDMNVDPVYLAKLEREINEGKLIVFAAQMHGNYVGRVGLCVSEADEEAFRQQLPSVPVVYSLEVLDGHKNQGIATQLMDIVESEVRRRGFDKIALGVVADNQIARTMYEARGYLYVRLGDSETIDSHWDVTGQDGGTEHVIVRLLPMVKSLSSR